MKVTQSIFAMHFACKYPVFKIMLSLGSVLPININMQIIERIVVSTRGSQMVIDK